MSGENDSSDSATRDSPSTSIENIDLQDILLSAPLEFRDVDVQEVVEQLREFDDHDNLADYKDIDLRIHETAVESQNVGDQLSVDSEDVAGVQGNISVESKDISVQEETVETKSLGVQGHISVGSNDVAVQVAVEFKDVGVQGNMAVECKSVAVQESVTLKDVGVQVNIPIESNDIGIQQSVESKNVGIQESVEAKDVAIQTSPVEWEGVGSRGLSVELEDEGIQGILTECKDVDHRDDGNKESQMERKDVYSEGAAAEEFEGDGEQEIPTECEDVYSQGPIGEFYYDDLLEIPTDFLELTSQEIPMEWEGMDIEIIPIEGNELGLQAHMPEDVEIEQELNVKDASVQVNLEKDTCTVYAQTDRGRMLKRRLAIDEEAEYVPYEDVMDQSSCSSSVLPLPISSRYQDMSVDERSKILYEFHTTVQDARDELARTSLQATAAPQPLSPSDRCQFIYGKGHSHDIIDTKSRLEIISEECTGAKRRTSTRRNIYTATTGPDVGVHLPGAALLPTPSPLPGPSSQPGPSSWDIPSTSGATRRTTRSQAASTSSQEYIKASVAAIEAIYNKKNVGGAENNSSADQVALSLMKSESDSDEGAVGGEVPPIDDEEMIECPICTVRFPASVIQRHASTCDNFARIDGYVGPGASGDQY